MRTLLRWLLWIVAGALTALLLAMVVVPRLMGWVPLTVLTGSMEPAIPPGSQVYVKPVEGASEVSVGDVITFMPNPDDDTLVTHRVTGIGVNGAGEKSFTTQGDANNAPDPEAVLPKQIRGVVVYHLPYVGHIALGIDGSTKIAAITVIGLTLIGYAIWQLLLAGRDRVRRRPDSEDETAPEEHSPDAEEVRTDA
ncbi:signal peptidase I [Brevibacterium luteolum]|uniref:Signal peptidase I n=1 Tax=Brevibacterium luteolum TaxID=199591 RepID=A0A849AQL9_9MICO|nr:signal peptidase I [Brevibacterium luteolum]MBM7530694.1 signal peptidase [Brevibacterium luteolum]NNG78082.1 signal peptidase I [Brevibacterium luteolum]